MKKTLFFAVLFIVTLVGSYSFADYPRPWQVGFQEPATELMEKFIEFHDLLLVIITAIVIFVLVLLVYVCIKFSAKANPVPSKTTHNTMLEIVWTAIPVVILTLITIPSLKILYYDNDIPDPELTVKVVGHQWYWEYQYPDNGEFSFDSYPIQTKDLKEGQMRLLEVDNKMYLPTDTNIKILTTAADVIHNWAMPSFGIKVDTIPGRVNHVWFNIKKPGTYYGQCSELCGVNHFFMPIVVEAVSKEEFAEWVKSKQPASTPEAVTPAIEPASAESPAAEKTALEKTDITLKKE